MKIQYKNSQNGSVGLTFSIEEEKLERLFNNNAGEGGAVPWPSPSFPSPPSHNENCAMRKLLAPGGKRRRGGEKGG